METGGYECGDPGRWRAMKIRSEEDWKIKVRKPEMGTYQGSVILE